DGGRERGVDRLAARALADEHHERSPTRPVGGRDQLDRQAVGGVGRDLDHCADPPVGEEATRNGSSCRGHVWCGFGRRRHTRRSPCRTSRTTALAPPYPKPSRTRTGWGHEAYPTG